MRRLLLLLWFAAVTVGAAPVIAPIANVTVPAGKSIIIPITATVTNGRPLAYTITGSTNAMAIVRHTNNPFFKLNVAQACTSNSPGAFQIPFRGGTATVTNVGDMTFMLLPEYASHSVAIFQGLLNSGFYNSNTIFQRVASNFVIQGGDPLTNGQGGLVFRYNDEFNPQAIFSGNGQLALANPGKNADGSQFFVTVGSQRALDFQYTLFGQLVRGFDVLTNVNHTAVDTNSRPLANEIITEAGLVPDTADTVITLTATNRARLTNTVTVIANDGAGGWATNRFIAVSITDSNSNNQPFLYGVVPTNLVAPANVTLTNWISAAELDGDALYWFPVYADAFSQTNSIVTGNPFNYHLESLTYNETNASGQLEFFVKPTNNVTGAVTIYWIVSPSSSEFFYYNFFGVLVPPYAEAPCTFVFGDTPISGQAAAIMAQPVGALTNLLLAAFTNGVPESPLTNFSASIQWGDDTISAGVITTNAAKGKEVMGTHTYTNSGIFSLTVTIQSKLGATTTISNTVTVMPSLSLDQAGPTVMLRWPSWAFAYGLQRTTDLTDGSSWAPFTNDSALSGFQNTVSNTLSPGAEFFRLMQ